MSKKQSDFVVYVRNSVLIQALVAFSRQVFTPATQTEPASSVEHLTLVYLDPAANSLVPTGEQLRNAIKVETDVPPLVEGKMNGWAEVLDSHKQPPADEDRIEGSPREVIDAVQFGAASEEIAHLRKELADAEADLSTASNTMGTLTQKVLDQEKEIEALKSSAQLSQESHGPFDGQPVQLPEGIVTESGKTEADLAADHAEQRASEAADSMTDTEKDALADAASAPVPEQSAIPTVGVGQPAQ